MDLYLSVKSYQPLAKEINGGTKRAREIKKNKALLLQNIAEWTFHASFD
jgi:hypothetical protein